MASPCIPGDSSVLTSSSTQEPAAEVGGGGGMAGACRWNRVWPSRAQHARQAQMHGRTKRSGAGCRRATKLATCSGLAAWRSAVA